MFSSKKKINSENIQDSIPKVIFSEILNLSSHLMIHILYGNDIWGLDPLMPDKLLHVFYIFYNINFTPPDIFFIIKM